MVEEMALGERPLELAVHFEPVMSVMLGPGDGIAVPESALERLEVLTAENPAWMGARTDDHAPPCLRMDLVVEGVAGYMGASPCSRFPF